ncbi:hypothetical protein [Endozoicomonas atrinae]|uniref:hypothetical protein n=1 Tax=Endozoicomonas atrinae TaxID=1333660 RepID=UPI0008253F3D|nr:hypothetical protein [Endozoicomonas atrinae]
MPQLNQTETIDRLFLELSQVTNAFTGRELALARAIERAFIAGLGIGNAPGFSMFDSTEQWEKYRDLILTDFKPIIETASLQ